MTYLGDAEIQYGDIILGITFCAAIWNLNSFNVNSKLQLNCFYLFGIVGLGIANLFFNPADVMTINFSSSWDLYLRGITDEMTYVSFSMQSILMYIRVCFFIAIILAAKSFLNTLDWMHVLRFLTNIAKILVIFGIFEIFIKYIIGYDLNEFLQLIFGRGIATGGDETRLQGISREPSIYALALFNMIILFIINIKLKIKIQETLIWLILTIAIGALASSFSFYLVMFSASAMIVGVYSTNIGKVNIKRFGLIIITSIVVIFMIGIIFLFWNSYFLYRVSDALTQMSLAFTRTYIIGLDFSSSASRLIGIFESFMSYTARPFLGLGIGTTYCVSGIVSILANIGLIGFIVWIRVLTVHYYRLNLLLIISLMLPVTLTNDLSTLYDTAYVALIPLLFIAVNGRSKINVN
ncbi:hypothetical protein N8473_05230 [Amylibacter sp.]|nr:hypothetical protein [Amylibacter sp.]